MLLHWLLLLAALPLLATGCPRQPTHRCHCRHVDIGLQPWKPYPYRKTGCQIVGPAPLHFKCQCHLRREDSCQNCLAPSTIQVCSGEAHPCRNDEACPGGRYSYCACKQGGGNCRGYPLRPSTEESCPRVNKKEAISSLRQYQFEDCECKYYNGGCRIEKAAPEGFKCACRDTTCKSYSIACDEDEYCPASDYTYCGCLRGRGNCNGYSDRDKQQNCDFGSKCDCSRSSDWTRGQYSIARVTFKQENLVRSDPKPVALARVLNNPNASGVPLTQWLEVSNTITSQSSFEHTHGVTVETGLEFVVKIPTFSLSLAGSYSYSFGETTTRTNSTSHRYTCTSPPKTLTRCTVYLMTSTVSVPYTMFLTHKTIPECTCKSEGIWVDNRSSISELQAEYIGPCDRLDDSRSCV